MNLYDKMCKNFFLIAGPCVIENFETTYETAKFLKEETGKRNILFIFKSSFEKANRTSINSFSGLGMKKGLEILKEIKEKLDLPVLTDLHSIEQVEETAKVVDIIQIPAFLARQSNLLIKCGQSDKIVNIKKAQFMAAEDLKHASEKILQTSQNNKILLTERGTSFGYHDLVVDFRNFFSMKSIGFPVIYDVTHSLQKPSIDKVSGGTPEFALPMARAALATKAVDGIFLETHPNPSIALSDGKSMLPTKEIPQFLDEILNILKANKTSL